MQFAMVWRGANRELWLARALPWQRGFWFDRVDPRSWAVGLGAVVLHCG